MKEILTGIFAVIAAFGTSPTLAATAETYPARPIRVIIPYPPGGTSDILARLIGNKLTESWKQQIVVDNRTGASGNIGLELGARATPDGHTFVLSDIGNAVIAPILYTNLPFDVLKDFAPAISSEKRLPTHPKTATVGETFPGFVTGSWQGILAPARTPPEVVAKINAEVSRILKLPDVISFLSSQGTTPLATSPQETGKWLAEERAKWVKVVKASGFKLEQ